MYPEKDSAVICGVFHIVSSLALYNTSEIPALSAAQQVQAKPLMHGHEWI